MGSAHARLEEPEQCTGLKALIIDDQRTTRRIVRRLLKQIGVSSVIEAGDGNAALTMIETLKPKARPDFVICDLHMDGMDGLSFCNKVRLNRVEALRNIPIIVLTGDSDALVRSVTEQIGVNMILSKPVSAPELRQGIASAVGSSLQ